MSGSSFSSENSEQISELVSPSYDKEIISKCDVNWWKGNSDFEKNERNVFNEIATNIANDYPLDDYIENITTKSVSACLVATTTRFANSQITPSIAAALDAVLIIYENLINYDEAKARQHHNSQPPVATSFLRKTAKDAFTAAYDSDPTFRANFDNAKAAHKKAVAQYEATIAANEIDTVNVSKNTAMKESVPVRPKDDLTRYGPLKDGGIYSSLFNLLNNNTATPFHIQKASFILSGLLSIDTESSHPAIRMLVQWIIAQIDNSTVYIPQALNALKNLLKSRTSHVAFELEDGVASLAKLITADTKQIQTLYTTLFCTWLVSFNNIFDEQIHNSHIVAKILNVVRIVPREKVTRISLNILVNFLERSEFAAEMIGADILKIISTLKLRNTNDQDIPAMLSTLESSISAKMSEFTSFDKYLAELNAGTLRKSPVHSEKFWSENCLKFEDNDYALVKRIVDQLSSESTDAIEIACYDLGEFARFHPEGKKVLNGDAKAKLMVHMTSENPAIAKAALLAVQKLLIRKWDVIATGKK